MSARPGDFLDNAVRRQSQGRNGRPAGEMGRRMFANYGRLSVSQKTPAFMFLGHKTAIYHMGECINDVYGVRPALWIDLES